VMVKRCGKSAPREAQATRHGKPRLNVEMEESNSQEVSLQLDRCLIGPELVLLHMERIRLGHFKSCMDLEIRGSAIQSLMSTQEFMGQLAGR